MVLRGVMRSPMKAARTAMSTGFSFVPARRRSREAQSALDLPRPAPLGPRLKNPQRSTIGPLSEGLPTSFARLEFFAA
jgi:hypothetical protein